MHRLILFTFFIIFQVQLFAQVNLVPNGDFETKLSCNIGLGDINIAIPWTSPSLGTSDYFNVCVGIPNDAFIPLNNFGYQLPHSGNGYAGFGSYFKTPTDSGYREYVQSILKYKLKAQTKYLVEYYVNLADRVFPQTAIVSINCIGAYLSDTSISVPTYSILPVTPQIQSNRSPQQRR